MNSTRRQFIHQVTVISALSLATSFGISLSAKGESMVDKLGVMPDEGELQQLAFIAFGAQRTIWGKMTEDVQIALGNIAQAIAKYQPVVIFCRESELDIADAHVDFYARFVRPGIVVANLDNDPDSYDYDVTRNNIEILQNSTDANGRKLQIHTMEPPLYPRESIFSKNNPDFAAGYINYFVINDAVIAPEFGDEEADNKAQKMLTELYPTRDIVMLNIDAIAAGGGGNHCVTHQLPSFKSI
ncbi:hypothetical protein GWI68_19915 [Proteus sp. G2669]|uniref:agmatine deiminase family protein n=1 Tax=unclassified Proteus (in: enterobacteria) TaxID=257482 RepID=UPI001411EB17|nr:MULTISPECIES: agmatine deiminase family protein [unclassified Proteus (in: enterobacteria)]NBM56981.1 hypothetical protein [Proteus sp. G2669]UDN37608.1 agmatine deiminase family protein [Proteus sp. NMG38-2]